VLWVYKGAYLMRHGNRVTLEDERRKVKPAMVTRKKSLFNILF